MKRCPIQNTVVGVEPTTYMTHNHYTSVPALLLTNEVDLNHAVDPVLYERLYDRDLHYIGWRVREHM